MRNPTAAGIAHNQHTRWIIRTYATSTGQKMEGGAQIVCCQSKERKIVVEAGRFVE